MNTTEQNKNIARVDLVLLSNLLKEHHPGLCIFHSGTNAGYYLVFNRERATCDMPLEALLAYCIGMFAERFENTERKDD